MCNIIKITFPDFAALVTSYMAGREDKRTNNRRMFPALKSNAAASYKGPVKNRAFERLEKVQVYCVIVLISFVFFLWIVQKLINNS